MTVRRADEAEIRRIIQVVAQAMHDKDVGALLADSTPELLTFDLAPPLLSRGLDRKGAQAWFDTWDGPIDFEIRDLEVTVGDEVAFATSLNRIGGAPADGGGRSDTWARTTIGLVKRDGRWLVTHRHESVPFYMDGSVKAALDLKPDGE